jgi:predicted metal-dependent HD superfamily phosphohydrolase
MYPIWTRTCEAHNVQPAVAKSWWDKIDKKYSEPHRFYHNQGMLAQKAELLNSVVVDSSIVFATIFQYFEFDVKVNSVEANCLAFREFLCDAGIEDVSTKGEQEGDFQTLLFRFQEKLRGSVLKMLGDETIDSVDVSVDEITFEYFQDMDLAVLGSPPEQYAQYVKLLQAEHEQIGLPVYRNMRLKVSLCCLAED